jgi:hypothetical protein
MRRPSAALILIASLLSFLMACPILAGPIEDSTKAYLRGDYKTAYQLIKPQAEKGDADAQFILGFMYDEGKGVPQDYPEAAKWYRRAAKQGNKAAQHNLGLMDDHPETEKWYRRAAEPGNAAAQSNLALTDDQSRGVPKDPSETEKWYRRAAEPGNAAAQSNLGLMYDEGKGVPRDYAEAVKWYRRAARQGNAKAQNNLGVMYREGQGIPQDHVLAYMWFYLATSRLAALDKEDREKAEGNRDRIASMMTPSQMAEAELLAREWKSKKER